MDKLDHYGVISSIVDDNLTPYYETTLDDELIDFITTDGIQRVVNSLNIWSNTTDLYVEINESGRCVVVPAYSFLNIDYIPIKNITITGLAGQQFRYLGLYCDTATAPVRVVVPVTVSMDFSDVDNSMYVSLM